MQIHQFHPSVHFGDAVSNHMLDLQKILRQAGYQSEIFCEQPAPLDFAGRTHPMAEYGRHSSLETLLLTHFSLGYPDNVLDWVASLPDRKAMIYHNITPPHYFFGVNDVYLEAAQNGYAQLSQLHKLISVGWGVSAFNNQDLFAAGWSQVDVLPIVFDPTRYAVRPDRAISRRFAKSPTILFVGRVAPNKRFEDLILIFCYLQQIMPDVQLVLVGGTSGMEPYLNYLQTLIQQLKLTNIHFVGHVSTEELVAYYQTADIYLSMSTHEGFGVPLLESMHFNIPIVAYQSSAIAETLGGVGVLLAEKRHAEIAELLALLLEDQNLRQQIIDHQKARPAHFSSESVGTILHQLIEQNFS